MLVPCRITTRPCASVIQRPAWVSGSAGAASAAAGTAQPSRPAQSAAARSVLVRLPLIELSSRRLGARRKDASESAPARACGRDSVLLARLDHVAGASARRVDVSVEQLVGHEGHEIGEVLLECHLFEDGARLSGASRGPNVLADLATYALGLLIEDLADELHGDGAAIVESRLVADPLPDLRAADLRCGGILHEVVYCGGTAA